MCGITGLIQENRAVPATELLESLARCVAHRGPDEQRIWTAPGVGFGFRRLAIIDLPGGKQPMSSEDGRYTLIFNGEIYNFQALREELEKTGRHRFHTRSDTEVLLHLYQEHGAACVERLRGMFAFAVYDKAAHSLFLARDRFGKKPLVYAQTPGGLIFASEIQALLKHPAVSREIDHQAIDLYLSLQYVPSPYSAFRQIRKLPPASTLLWKNGKIEQIRPYWDLSYQPKLSIGWEDAKRELMTRLREAVKLRMISDVPLGAFLSGGKDSSIVVGLMSELSSQPVKTFSIGFEEEAFSELPYARLVAKRFGTNHHEFTVKPDALDILPIVAQHYGEPFADSSAIPSYYVSRMTRQHVTVALNGDGGDEVFAGYPRYQAMKFMMLYENIPRPLRKGFAALFSGVREGNPPHSLAWRLKRLFTLGLQDPRTTYLDTVRYLRESQKPDIYTAAFQQQVRPHAAPDYLKNWFEKAGKATGTDRFLYVDLHTYLPECLMVKMDIASMANSLEARSPFLDHELAGWVARLPDTWKLKGLRKTKHILTAATKGWLPDAITTRRKQGFAIPISHWLRGPLKTHLETTLLSGPALHRGLFKKEAIQRLLTENANGRIDHSYALWAFLMLETWFQTVVDPS